MIPRDALLYNQTLKILNFYKSENATNISFIPYVHFPAGYRQPAVFQRVSYFISK